MQIVQNEMQTGKQITKKNCPIIREKGEEAL
jgi:hypothetical protein